VRRLAAMPMIEQTLALAPLGANCSILAGRVSRRGVVVDPGGEAERIIDLVRQLDLEIEHVFLTHGHFDHCYAAPEVCAATGARLWLHRDDWEMALAPDPLLMRVLGCEARRVEPTDAYEEGDVVKAGELKFEVWHTPGHTPGSVCLRVEETILTGDTVFADGVGRHDLPGGDQAQLRVSLRRFARLPDDLRILPGHGPPAEMRYLKRFNPYLSEL
jgi:hydroxyacylglutathione hydrolase